MTTPDECICGLCGFCQAKAEAKEADTTQPKENKNKDPRKKKKHPVIQHGATGVRVFVLGTLDAQDGSVPGKQIDVYSGLNGLHIRTLPGRRWKNPVLVGAGYGYLAVVDRFVDYDVIRITDQYAGAEETDFDSNGMPSDSVDWENLEDFYQINTPSGTHCTGLKINRNGVLIGGVSGDKARFIKADIRGHAGEEDVVSAFDGEVDITPIFSERLGESIGNPAEIEASPSDKMHNFMGISTGDGANAVFHLNLVTGEIERLLGLPIGEEPMAVGHAGQIVSILCGTEGVATRVLRFNDKDSSYMMSDTDSPKSTPAPQTFQVSHTFSPQDYPLPENASPEEIKKYLNITNVLNNGEAEAQHGDTREIVPSQTSDALNENRTQDPEGKDSTSFYQSKNYDVPVSFINVPTNSGLIFFESCFNTLTELYNKFEIAQDGSPTDAIDTTQIIFRAVNATYYDYLSDGGFTYGCRKQAGGVSIFTNGLKGIHLATDQDDTPGTLKPLRDLKAALVDSGTGLILYRYMKPLAYPFYAGSYVTLTPVTGASRTECTTEAETMIESFDGIARPGFTKSEDYPEAFDNANEYDSPWTLFIRHVRTPRNLVNLKPKAASWTSRDDDGSYLPEWNPQTKENPVEGDGNWLQFWPWTSGSHNTPEFSSSGAGGFFAVDGKKYKTTAYAQANAEIADLQAQNAVLQAAIDSRQLTEAQAVAYEADIESNNNSIAQLQTVFENPDESIWAYPPGYFNTIFNNIALSESQDTTDPNETDPTAIEPVSEVVTAPSTIDEAGTIISVPPALSVVQLGEQLVDASGRPMHRGCVIEPGFKGWAAIEVNFTKEGVSSDGSTGYTNPEFRANGLGKMVGSAPPYHGYPGHSAGYVYESGYTASGGAITDWDVDISLFSDMGLAKTGADTKNCAPTLFPCSAYQFRSPDEVLDLAPPDIGSILANTLYVNQLPSIDNVFHKGYVFGCYDPLWSVCVKAILMNLAFDVYRYGYRTFQVDHPGTPICAGADPGYFVSHNCEAIDCGNVQCLSFVFYGNKLYADDPVYPVIRTPILSVNGYYNMKEDPYKDMDISVGRFISVYMELKLNNPVWNFDMVMP